MWFKFQSFKTEKWVSQWNEGGDFFGGCSGMRFIWWRGEELQGVIIPFLSHEARVSRVILTTHWVSWARFSGLTRMS